MTEEAVTPSPAAGAPTPPAADPAATAKPAVAPAAPPEAPKEQTVPLSRLQAVIAQKAELDRANEALKRELKLSNETLEEFRAIQAKGATADPAKPGEAPASPAPRGARPALSPEELQSMVREEASKQSFNARCNESVAEGRKAHADFDKVVLGDLTSVSPVVDRTSGRPVLPTGLVEAALETGNSHEVLYALGQDIAEASRIMALSPVRQAVELTRFAAKLSAAAAATEEAANEEAPRAPNVSRAPAPIKSPTKAGGTKPAFTLYDTENFSTEEWIRQREKQVRVARANGGR